MNPRSSSVPHIWVDKELSNNPSVPPLAKGAGGEPAGFSDRYAAARPLTFDPETPKFNHGIFRYPAKFHPPVARKLVELFSHEGDTLLDPFCGSGTLLVEASVLKRNCIGTDVDPLAVFVSQAKTGIASAAPLQSAASKCIAWLDLARAADIKGWGRFSVDISERVFSKHRPPLNEWIPELPNIEHWFRRRAVLQLAAIRRHVAETYSGEAKQFLELCFAAVIRNASNADPVPVSGLEVTSHMLAKEAKGRIVDPWQLMSRTVARALAAMEAYLRARPPGVTSTVLQADARELEVETTGRVSAVVTSPPYLTAVDYYRRHTLEMYWLGLTDHRDERLKLMGKYIGRDRVGGNHFKPETALASAVANRWVQRFPAIQAERERAFRHYCDGMARALARMADVVVPGGPIVIVAGDVRFCGVPVSMLELMKDLADDRLGIADHLWYPIVNRYMSYTRRNEASIAADHVIVFRRRS